MKSLSTFALLFVLAANANAFNVTVDFEDSPLDGDTTPGAEPIESQGFNFSGLTEKGVTNWPLGPVDDSKALHWCSGFICSASPTITMTQDGGVLFDLLSMELAVDSQPMDFEIIGFFGGGGSISTTFSVGLGPLTQFNLGAGWIDLESVTIESLGDDIAVALDNVVVSTVPVPAAVWMFGSALAGLGWMRRKQAAISQAG